MIMTSTRPEFRRKLRFLKKMAASAAKNNPELYGEVQQRTYALQEQRYREVAAR